MDKVVRTEIRGILLGIRRYNGEVLIKILREDLSEVEIMVHESDELLRSFKKEI